MADQVDSMTDAQLRTKLAEHGFPVMPITASTRSLLVKKLKLVLDNKSKSRSTESKVEAARKYARYSSGEDSDMDSTNTKEKRGRRATTGGSMLPPSTSRTRRPTPKKDSPAKRDIRKESDSDEEKPPVRTHEEVETVTTRRVTRTYAGKDQDDYETGSDSDVDMDRKTASPLRSNSRSSDHISSTLPTADVTTSQLRPSVYARPSVSGIGLSTTSSASPASDHLNLIRSRLGLPSSLADRPPVSTYKPSFSTSTYQPSTSAAVDEVESPYLSNFTRRLTSLKAEPPRSTSYLDRDTTNGNSAFLPRRSYITSASRSDVDYTSSSDRRFLKNNIVSLALVGLVTLFFFLLFFMYIVKKNDITSVVDEQSGVTPLCKLNIPSDRPGINCVPKEQISYTKDLFKVLHPELMLKAAAYQCGTPNALPYLTEREILDIACARSQSVEVSQCRTDLNNLEIVLLHNPLWGVSVVQRNNVYTNDPDYTPITSMEEIVRQRIKGTVALAITDPSTPFSCLIYNTLYSTGSTVVITMVIGLLVFAIHKSYKVYVAYKKRKSEEIYTMVEQIIDVISQETEDGNEPYISVDHVRDTLISPQNREKMAPVWDAAVKFIQMNESRARMEIQTVNGEDCRVWRWISVHNSPRRSASWQGQAFETQEGSVNNLTVSPTPCLKIRHMFEKNDINPNLRNVIQDAILEKCAGECNILHIDVDMATFCVYVKCATSADAGIVYRNLHGWWYEGRLITVKYLRLERYMQRFPNSPTVGPPYLGSTRQRRNWEE